MVRRSRRTMRRAYRCEQLEAIIRTDSTVKRCACAIDPLPEVEPLPDAVLPLLEPVLPEVEPVAPLPEAVVPPEPVAPLPEPVVPLPEPVAPLPEPVDPAPRFELVLPEPLVDEARRPLTSTC